MADRVLLLTASASALAQPRTLYKPEDIENARQNMERYAWAQAIVTRWERSVGFALEQDREFFVNLIPELTPGTAYGQNCPACVGVKSLEGESSLFGWSITAPEQVTCRRCGAVFPNEQYPETGVLECPRMGQTFTYYQAPAERALGPDATPEQRREKALRGLSQVPQMTSLGGAIRLHKAHWAWGQLPSLAKLYALTQDVRYAERVAWILDRFAEVSRTTCTTPMRQYRRLATAEVAANMGDPATLRAAFPPGHPQRLRLNRSDAQGSTQRSTTASGAPPASDPARAAMPGRS